MFIEGHIHHKALDMSNTLHRALWHSHHFQRMEPLHVNVIETNFINAVNGYVVLRDQGFVGLTLAELRPFPEILMYPFREN